MAAMRLIYMIFNGYLEHPRTPANSDTAGIITPILPFLDN